MKTVVVLVFLSAQIIVTQMKNRLLFFQSLHYKAMSFARWDLQSRLAGGAGSRTFDVSDLRSRRQAYVLAAPVKTAVTCIPMQRCLLRRHTNQVV